MSRFLSRTAFFPRAAACAFLFATVPAQTNFAWAQDFPPVATLETPPVARVSVAPALSVGAERIVSGSRIALLLTNSAPPARVRIALYEAEKPALAASISGDVRRNARDWTRLADGSWQTALQIEAAPGRYIVRLVADDKTRTPLALAPAALTVSGIARIAGAWLPDGALVVRSAQNDAPTQQKLIATAPLFILGLKRGENAKKFEARDVSLIGETRWKTVPLLVPAAAWKPDFDANTLHAQLKDSLDAARAAGESGFYGVEVYLLENLPTRFGGLDGDETKPKVPLPPSISPAEITRVAALVRSTVENAAPGAALVFSAPARFFSPIPPPTSSRSSILSMVPKFDRTAQLFAARCDAIFVSSDEATPDAVLWATKAARRVAEEQPNYDLPILVQQPYLPEQSRAAFAHEILFAGATTLVPFDKEETSSVLFSRNRSLFVGSVTLEDIGILPAPDGEDFAAPAGFTLSRTSPVLPQLDLYKTLRDIGRIPLLARIDGQKPESFAVALGNRVSPETMRALRQNAERGARIYLEGAPHFDNLADEASFALLVGANAKPLDKPRETAMILQDGWTFGTGRGTRVTVMQNATLTLLKPTMSSQTKDQKGLFRPTSARAAAVLEDGTPALVINPIGKGEVVWLPHAFTASAATKDLNVQAATRLYYSAVAAYIEPGLVSLVVKAAGAKTFSSSTTGVRVALRRSPKGALLMLLSNATANAVSVKATIDGAAGIALDLESDAILPLDVRGFASETTTEIPAKGAKIIVFAKTRAELDAERNAPIARASLK